MFFCWNAILMFPTTATPNPATIMSTQFSYAPVPENPQSQDATANESPWVPLPCHIIRNHWSRLNNWLHGKFHAHIWQSGLLQQSVPVLISEHQIKCLAVLMANSSPPRIARCFALPDSHWIWWRFTFRSNWHPRRPEFPAIIMHPPQQQANWNCLAASSISPYL